MTRPKPARMAVHRKGSTPIPGRRTDVRDRAPPGAARYPRSRNARSPETRNPKYTKESDTNDMNNTNPNDNSARPDAIGVDYQLPLARSGAPAAVRPRMWLASAATARNRFAIVGSDHVALWRGDFDAGDDDYPDGDPLRAELAAAKRAIWLAGQARRAAIAAPRAVVALTLARALDQAILHRIADQYGLDLELAIDETNPAVAWCNWSGRRRWSAATIAALATGGAKPTPDDVITARERELTAATTHGQVFRIAAEHGLNNHESFPLFKRALKDRLGIDYDQLRSSTEAARHAAATELAEAASSGPHITLAVAADAAAGQFAVCGAAGQPVWYGRFRDDEQFDHQSHAEHAAARKAIWLAGQARMDSERPAATLHLTMSRPDVNPGDLESAAASARLLLDVRIADLDNPASEWCAADGWLHYRSTPMASLLDTAQA